jgi:hypothetical protein
MSGIIKKILYNDLILYNDIQEAHKAMKNIEQACDKLGEAFSHLTTSVQDAAKALQTFGEMANRAMREAYDDAGQPYGPTDAAMVKWFEDVAKERAAQEKAEHDALWQQALARVRETGRKKTSA